MQALPPLPCCPTQPYRCICAVSPLPLPARLTAVRLTNMLGGETKGPKPGLGSLGGAGKTPGAYTPMRAALRGKPWLLSRICGAVRAGAHRHGDAAPLARAERGRLEGDTGEISARRAAQALLIWCSTSGPGARLSPFLSTAETPEHLGLSRA